MGGRPTHAFQHAALSIKRLTIRLSYRSRSHTHRNESLAVSSLRDKHATRAHAGAPGLLALQYVVDRITPYTLAAALEQSLKDTLRDMNIPQARQLGSAQP